MKASALTIAPAPFVTVKAFVVKHHYSHSVNGVKARYCFQVGYEGALVGAVLFGAMSTTAWRRFSDSEEKVLELRRLVLLDEAERNSESRVIGWCLRWIRKHLPTIEVVVSYADPAQGHTGSIYRASNFEYLGVTAPDVGLRDVQSGKTYHSRALRTRDSHGFYKPFVVKLRLAAEAGALEKIPLPGKHCFIYRLRETVQGGR